ncbi:hypothetical protein GIB67_007855 [Kingdonia uniflora]|uniref:Uncharacterized protein n=1 Tax=Kingdonia uniflora TaxID=39325 RepID=A0A7J7ML86_9MAGN|nr:hypothetical protein GIB67_007855 [Kingdonia uniflora]
MDIEDNIDIAYYNGTSAEVVEEGFLCYLNQVAYGFSIPLTFFQKGVMNALKSFPGQLNGNIFEMMRVCKALNQKWRDGGIARQFIADDVLKYYKFKYVKDRKSGYLFSDSVRPKFFDFESSGRPWYDHLVMLSIAWMSASEVLKLAATNRGELVRQHDAEKAALREQFEQEKVLQREKFEKEKALQKDKFEKEAAATKEDVDLALARKYGEIVFPGDDTSPVAEQTPAPPMADDPTKEEVVHLRGKVIEMEKALSRVRDSINRTQQGQRAMRILFFNIKKEDRKIYAQLEINLRHACDELERCKGHNACLEREKKITPKRGKSAINTDHERQIADVIAFYGGELERVENEFSRYISRCGKDVEVENVKVENMWFAKGNEGRGASTSKSRAEESEEEEVEDLLPHTRHKTRPQEITDLDRDKQALILECTQDNKFFEELHVKYKESQVILDAAKDEINYSREVDKKLQRLKHEMERSVQIRKQYRGSLLQEKKSLEARCKDLENELNKVKTKFCEATMFTADNVMLRTMAMFYADVEKF